jgi:hypothetical protein
MLAESPPRITGPRRLVDPRRALVRIPDDGHIEHIGGQRPNRVPCQNNFVPCEKDMPVQRSQQDGGRERHVRRGVGTSVFVGGTGDSVGGTGVSVGGWGVAVSVGATGVSVGGGAVAVSVAACGVSVAEVVGVAVVVGVLEGAGRAVGEEGGFEARAGVLAVEVGVGDGTASPSPPMRVRTRYSPARTRAATIAAPTRAHTDSRRLASGWTAATSLFSAASGSVAAL